MPVAVFSSHRRCHCSCLLFPCSVVPHVFLPHRVDGTLSSVAPGHETATANLFAACHVIVIATFSCRVTLTALLIETYALSPRRYGHYYIFWIFISQNDAKNFEPSMILRQYHSHFRPFK